MEEKNYAFNDIRDFCKTFTIAKLDLMKIDSHPFHGKLSYFWNDSVLISKFDFSCSLKQTIHPPQHYKSFVLAADSNQKFIWRGRCVDHNSLLIFPPDSVSTAVNEENFKVYVFCIEDMLLEHLLKKQQNKKLLQKINSNDILRVDQSRMRLFRSLVEPFFSSIESSPNSQFQSLPLVSALLDLINEGMNVSLKDIPSVRHYELIKKIDRYILEHASEAPTVKDLCNYTSVSIRTMQYAVSHHYGMTPKAYINTIRLNLVHNELKAAEDKNKRIVDVANSLGYWHMGQFAADYQKLFSEKPSETLRKSAS